MKSCRCVLLPHRIQKSRRHEGGIHNEADSMEAVDIYLYITTPHEPRPPFNPRRC